MEAIGYIIRSDLFPPCKKNFCNPEPPFYLINFMIMYYRIKYTKSGSGVGLVDFVCNKQLYMPFETANLLCIKSDFHQIRRVVCYWMMKLRDKHFFFCNVWVLLCMKYRIFYADTYLSMELKNRILGLWKSLIFPF